MGSEWTLCTWGDLATLEYGRALRGYESTNGSYPVYGTNGQIGWHTEPLFGQPSVIIGRKGAYRGVHYSSMPFFAIDTAFYLKPKTELDTRWAYYELLTHDINSMDSGSAIPSTSREDFYKLPVYVPPRAEQRAIAGILGALDDKIELNRRMNETLEGMARALFQSWFVDFDPVRAKAEGRQPEGMDAETAALFPDGFEESALGLIPQGWGVGKASTILSISREGLNPGAWPHEVFDHYSIPAYDGERLPVAEAGASIKSNKFLVTDEAVLISKLNPHIPRVWLPSLSRERRSICSTEFLVLCPVAPASRAYLYGLLGSTAFLEVFGSLVTGTSGSHQRVQPDSLLNVDVILPGSELIGRFTSAVLSMHERVHRNLQESRTLAATRDALLPKLLSGEVRVGEAERVVMEGIHVSGGH